MTEDALAVATVCSLDAGEAEGTRSATTPTIDV
jgi:hypothetical protein